MAAAGKFTHPASVVAVSCLVLILLSVSAAGERQCSWCGPLAEQVHRSQRAPSCDEPGETTCDNGLSHCAIVATSPPYVESRLCVKFYQDECFSIFCNSSRTWKMTCPCRGDFCNNEKTEREDEAFAFLARLGSKIQNLRIKKRTVTPVTPVKFLPSQPNKSIVDNVKNNNESNMNYEVDIQTVDNTTHVIDNVTTSETVMKNVDGNMINNSNNDTNEMNQVNVETSNIPSITHMNAEATTSLPNFSAMTNDLITISEMPGKITQNDLQMKTIMLSTIETRKDINIDVMNNIDHAAESVTEKSIDEKISMKMDIKPSAEMPSAEALQQNASPSPVTEKAQPITEHATETTSMMTTVHTRTTVTAKPMEMKKNNAVGISLQYLLMLPWVMLNYV